ncbi:uncharacterized protein LOC128325997 [Hemicordylus capensis]|uniref:uncharacterized protein LOC128325997 n=1 Tax=Hemicordylus capensis TaxID=884348 RepID=UPI002304698F|nr:uncharacterized protein LOC128325997 [Hemicordylus capensis]
MFPLCRTCATNKQLEECAHTNEEQSLIGTWCTVELMEAMARGYTVVKIYEVWHFENKSDKLFTGYINTFLRQKQEMGFPQWCVSAEEKEKYIHDYHKREGVLLRQDQIGVNPTKCQIAKLFLNSLWGKFAQRTNLPNTTILRDPDKFFHYLFSDKYEVSMCEFIDDDTFCVCWKHAQDRITTSGTTNVFVACFTTAYGRLELYQLLHKLQECRLYHDTDSVIFVSHEGLYNSPLSDFLGELTSELPSDQHITEFVSTGPKSYGYKLSGGETCVKVKGITLNFANNQNFLPVSKIWSLPTLLVRTLRVRL